MLLTLLLALTSAQATTVSSDRIAVGVHPDGSLVDQQRSLGMIWDPDGAQGPENIGGDFILRGWDWETWALYFEREDEWHTTVQGGPHLDGGLELEWDEAVATNSMVWLQGAVEFADVAITLTIEIPWEGKLIPGRVKNMEIQSQQKTEAKPLTAPKQRERGPPETPKSSTNRRKSHLGSSGRRRPSF